MNAPLKIHPLMLAAVVTFWGWQSGQWLAAVPAAALLCASFYVPVRWALTDTQRHRVADFCTVLALLIGAWLWVTYGNPRAVILFFLWLPLMLLPVALMHAYGGEERMNLAVLFWSVRRQPFGKSARAALFDPWFSYYALWLVAASAANQRDEWFYVGLVALVSWPLVRIRPWSYGVSNWGMAFSAAVLLGYGLFHGLNVTQNWLEAAVPEWINATGSRTDPYRASTDIGHIGKLKESNSIVLRVTTPDGRKPPRLLHRASYNTYFEVKWLARGAAFSRLSNSSDQRWMLAPIDGEHQRITLHDYATKPNPLLTLPTGTTTVERLSAIEAQNNALGAVQITREPGYFSYGALFGGGHALEGAPTPLDTEVPAREREAFRALAAELGLTPARAAEAVEQVTRFFGNGYRYSTFQKDAPLTGSPLVDFLHRSKSGHCEYFASATVLLLRAGGIPARYATGFATGEKNDREGAWIVRTRHAHAWVRAYVDGAWIDIDTTPASWLDVEAAQTASVWSSVTDLGSWLHFRASQAWADSDDRQLLKIALIVVSPFLLWLAWRLWRSRRRAKNSVQRQSGTNHTRNGEDSEWYVIERRLGEQGLGRLLHETTSAWLARLATDTRLDAERLSALKAIVDLHDRYRFDPMGLDVAQRAQLTQSAQRWLNSAEGYLPVR